MRYLFTLFIIICHLNGSGQHSNTVINAPKDWLSEIIPFPLSFAPSIPFNGFEDLRFAPTWSDSTSPYFWTYMFVWYIEKDSAITDSLLTCSLNAYYDGLMGLSQPNNADTSKIISPNLTQTELIKSDTGYTGNMRVYDAFFTKQNLVFNIKIKILHCPTTHKEMIWCEISPKHFSHPVWQTFHLITPALKCE